MHVEWKVYVALSLVMFFEYAVWGAWAPVLAARLLGPLKMTGKQTGWIYATLPLACIFSPLVAGHLADGYFNTEWILAATHALAALFMFAASRQKSFPGLFLLMFCWSLCYAGTMPLVNSVLFHFVKDGGDQGKVFIWAPVAWALVGYSLSGWRMSRKAESDGADAMIFSGMLGLVMAGCCLLLPAMAPSRTGEIPIIKALTTLHEHDFLLFMLASMCVAGTMQFYFLGSGRYMMDRGISGKAVPGAMAMAQAAQAAATLFALGPMIESHGFKWTLTIGAACWCLLYAVYVLSAPRAILIVAQVLHGLAYVFFMIVGQIYAGKMAPPGGESSMQGLIFAATTGVGLFFGTQLAGITMDRFSTDGLFRWRKIWAVPLLITLVGTLVFAFAFRGELPKDGAAPAKAAVAAQR